MLRINKLHKGGLVQRADFEAESSHRFRGGSTATRDM